MNRREWTTRTLLDGPLPPDAVQKLLPLVYEDLRVRAERVAREANGTLAAPTSLVHEAYLKLVDQDRATYASRLHFLAIASTAMRRLLIDRARHGRVAARHAAGGDADAIGRALETQDFDAADLLDLHAALERLCADDERAGKVVELRFFGGLSMQEVADHLGVALPTVERDWRYARAWLVRELTP